jgi:N4-gp56 family major capsid protein
MTIHAYAGALSPRTTAKASKSLLMRAVPYLVFEKFGQAKPLGKNQTKSQTFRRYESLDATPKTLTEGVTPSSSNVTKTDYTATLQQRGDWVELTDVIQDTHEDPVLQEMIEILGEQAAEMMERARHAVLKAGTNVMFANGATRASVNTPLTRALQRKATRSLWRQNAKKVTNMVGSSANYGTEPVAPSYVGIAHPDLESDIRDMQGFVPCEKYASGTKLYGDNEIGKVENVRYVLTTVCEPWADAGATPTDVLSTTGTSADVYPVLWIARDAYGIVPLKGKNAIQMIVRNPQSDSSDPLAQRGSAGWKGYETTVILNDAWMIRGEVAVSSL